MSATDETRMSTEDFELTEDMLEGVSGGEFAVTEEIFMDRLISSTKDRGETLDELISFVKNLNARTDTADLKGFWSWIAEAEPEKINEMVEYFRQKW